MRRRNVSNSCVHAKKMQVCIGIWGFVLHAIQNDFWAVRSVRLKYVEIIEFIHESSLNAPKSFQNCASRVNATDIQRSQPI